MSNINENHPECREGERFVTNIRTEAVNGKSDWDGIVWKTKRLGTVAYWPNGTVIPNMKPVFVQAQEREAGMAYIDAHLAERGLPSRAVIERLIHSLSN